MDHEFQNDSVAAYERGIRAQSIAGYSNARERVENDFYATPPHATQALLDVEPIIYPALEPACGEGHIAAMLTEGEVVATDLIDRGYGEGGIDFLTHDFGRQFATVITNPPFTLFCEFVERGLELSTHKLILFGKIQALEGQERASLLERSPLKTIYVFKKRVSPLRNGEIVDENGRPWTSMMCFAWFVFEHGYTGRPQIVWI